MRRARMGKENGATCSGTPLRCGQARREALTPGPQPIKLTEIVGYPAAGEVPGVALPDFLLTGAPKAGTTALHVALAAPPELFMSPVKEPKFFLTDGPPPRRGGGPGDAQTYREHVWRRQDYEALFRAAPPGTLRGESTPFYLYDRQAQRRVPPPTPRPPAVSSLAAPGRRGARP